MKTKLIKRLTVMTWAVLALSGGLSVWLLLRYHALGPLPDQNAELRSIEAMTNPLDWKGSALSLTMNRHEIVALITTGLLTVVVVQAAIIIIGAISLIWVRRIATLSGENHVA
jgi:hypothetical protein